MDFFDRQWTSYRCIVDHNLMEHRQVATATAHALEGWLASRPSGAPAPRMVDLGCGDLALLAPLLRRLPLDAYTGLDLAAGVLPLAERALGPVAYRTHWQEGDLLAWANGGGEPVDILHSAFAIHHLNDAQKLTFLEAARGRLNPGGVFVWADIFREPNEDLAHYRDRYVARICSGWQPLSVDQQSNVIEHVCSFDLPADRQTIVERAEACGWRWQWLWQGQHRAEALAVLTPA